MISSRAKLAAVLAMLAFFAIGMATKSIYPGARTAEHSQPVKRDAVQSEYERLGCESPRESVRCMEEWKFEKRREEMAKQLEEEGFFD